PGRAALAALEARSMPVRCSEIGNSLRIGRRQRSGALGFRPVYPDGVDRLLPLLGQIAAHLPLALPAAREESAGLTEVETSDVSLLVIGPGRDTKQLRGGVVAGKGPHPRRRL